MALFIPDIGARGNYVLKVPYDTLLTPKTSYICQGVRRLEDLIANAEDPFALFYEPVGLTREIYNSDLANNASIVALQSGMGQWVYVPNTYLAMYPDMNGVVYRAIMLGISLGALPDTLSLEAVKTSVTNHIYDLLGVDSVVKEVIISTPSLIPKEDSDLIEAARLSKVSITMSDSAQLAKAKTELATARLQITKLEDYIKNTITP